MKTSVSTTVKVTIEGKTFELSKTEAEKLRDDLDKALPRPVWQPPIIIDRTPPRRNPYDPLTPAHWPDVICSLGGPSQHQRIGCGPSNQFPNS